MRRTGLICSLTPILLFPAAASAQWEPAEGPLATRWAAEVSPDRVHPGYPRPQMQRASWVNLNGLWDYSIAPRERERPSGWDGKILVPFPVESALSGVRKAVSPGQRLWYRREFERPALRSGGRLLLHFGAVDWQATVWVNSQKIGEHAGGYDAFSFDITDALTRSGEQELVVAVWDPTDTGYQPCGKQVLEPRGIWYTAVTGIWQTVWLEPVPRVHIRSLRLEPDVSAGKLKIEVDVAGVSGGGELHALYSQIGADAVRAESRSEVELPSTLEMDVTEPRLWSPSDPHLYPLRVGIRHGDDRDEVESYFAMRTITVAPDAGGVPRFHLNGESLFHYGTLDQGWWPDGLYTAPTDEALRYDLEVTKRLGFNMVRKHVKIESERWYYHCDRLGLMVWQDLPSADRGAKREKEKRELLRSSESIEQYERELDAMIRGLGNHPSIVMWVPFNEGWGQFDTVRITERVKRRDASRLVISASGWHDFGVGDAHDIHSYPGPAIPPLEERRAAVLGEFGGLGLPLPEHTWQNEKNWGYRSFDTRDALQAAYLDLQRKLLPLVHGGLAGAVYTQTTDVEIEVNGLMSYDRAVVKMDPEALAAAHARLYLPPPRLRTVVATSESSPQHWRYATQGPAGEWQAEAFDDTGWQLGPGGFGSEGTPGGSIRTVWKTPEIWMRRVFELRDGALSDPHLRIHHDEDAEVYVNGVLVARAEGFTSGYVLLPLERSGAFRTGRNTLAVHCKQTKGGQYIDVGVVELLRED